GGERQTGGGRAGETVAAARGLPALPGGRPVLGGMVDAGPAHDRRYSIDASKVSALGWAPQHSLESGLAETVQWYRSHRDWWEPIKSGEFLDYYKRQYAARLS